MGEEEDEDEEEEAHCGGINSARWRSKERNLMIRPGGSRIDGAQSLLERRRRTRRNCFQFNCHS